VGVSVLVGVGVRVGTITVPLGDVEVNCNCGVGVGEAERRVGVGGIRGSFVGEGYESIVGDGDDIVGEVAVGDPIGATVAFGLWGGNGVGVRIGLPADSVPVAITVDPKFGVTLGTG
jgi:hypothetical protein